jgi:hypothetical protein
MNEVEIVYSEIKENDDLEIEIIDNNGHIWRGTLEMVKV